MQGIHITVLARETEKDIWVTDWSMLKYIEAHAMKSLYEKLGDTYIF